MTRLPTIKKNPSGATLSCKGWPQEAAMRLLLNSFDPEVAERPNESSVGNVSAATGPEPFQPLVAALRELADNETLFVKSIAPSGVFVTGATFRPAVLIVTGGESVAAPASRITDKLHRLSQISVSAWFYVGPQGALQATYEILGAAARLNFAGTLAGKLVVACGLGAVGGAQPLAATLHGAAALGIESDSVRIKQRVKSGYCEIMVNDLDEALRILKNSVRRREPASVAMVGDCEKVIPELANRGVVPDLLFPNFLERNAGTRSSTAAEMPAISELQRMGAIVLDGEVSDPRPNASSNIEGDREPLTFIALSASPSDIAHADRLLLELFHANEPLQRWLPLARKHVRFQGLPARVVWLNPAERLQFALALNDLVARGQFQAPLVLAHADFSPGKSLSPPAADVDAHFGFSGPATESLVRAASRRATGAFLASIEFVGTSTESEIHPIARAILADGTAATAERMKSALNDDQAWKRDGDLS